MKLFLILAGIILLAVFVFVIYCCLAMASIADRRLERLEMEHQSEQQKDNLPSSIKNNDPVDRILP